MPDLTADLARIERHIPHLEAAAADEDATPQVRAVLTAELAAWRMAARLAGRSRMVSDGSGCARNETERHGTEENHD